jgi:hypothetical protein
MTVVTLHDQDVDNCIRLIHLNKRSWRPEDIPERLMKELFQNWDSSDEDSGGSLESALPNPQSHHP